MSYELFIVVACDFRTNVSERLSHEKQKCGTPQSRTHYESLMKIVHCGLGIRRETDYYHDMFTASMIFR